MILVCISDYESLPQINPPQDDSQLNLTGIKIRVGGGRQIKISAFIGEQRSIFFLVGSKKMNIYLLFGIMAFSFSFFLFYKGFPFQGAKRASFTVRSLDLPSKALLSTEPLLSLRYSPPMVLSWYSWNCPLTKRNTRLDFPTADSPNRTNLNWHILLAWGCPLGLAVLLLVMASFSEWERVEGGECHKAAKGGGGRGGDFQASTVL